MRKNSFGLLRLLVAVVCAGLLPHSSTGASLKGTGQGTATVTLVRPLSILRHKDLVFGFMRGGESAGAVTVTTAGTRTTSGGAVLLSERRFHPAEFGIVGGAGQSYVIELPDAVRTIRRGPAPQTGNEPMASDFTSFSVNEAGAGAGRLNGEGRDTVLVGGTVEVPAGLRPGIYSAQLPMTVSYQ